MSTQPILPTTGGGSPTDRFGGNDSGTNEGLSRDRIVNLVIASVTTIFVFVTLISTFVFKHLRGVNIFFGLVICAVCASHLSLILLYRRCNLDSRFRLMVYYNAFTIVLLCVVANVYIHDY